MEIGMILDVMLLSIPSSQTPMCHHSNAICCREAVDDERMYTSTIEQPAGTGMSHANDEGQQPFSPPASNGAASERLAFVF